MTTTAPRKLAATFLLTGLTLGGAVACSDEDGDGSTANEEVEQVEQDARDAGDEVEQQVDEGAEDDSE